MQVSIILSSCVDDFFPFVQFKHQSLESFAGSFVPDQLPCISPSSVSHETPVVQKKSTLLKKKQGKIILVVLALKGYEMLLSCCLL